MAYKVLLPYITGLQLLSALDAHKWKKGEKSIQEIVVHNEKTRKELKEMFENIECSTSILEQYDFNEVEKSIKEHIADLFYLRNQDAIILYCRGETPRHNKIWQKDLTPDNFKDTDDRRDVLKMGDIITLSSPQGYIFRVGTERCDVRETIKKIKDHKESLYWNIKAEPVCDKIKDESKLAFTSHPPSVPQPVYEPEPLMFDYFGSSTPTGSFFLRHRQIATSTVACALPLACIIFLYVLFVSCQMQKKRNLVCDIVFCVP